jgi:hypothetical protein
MTGDKIARDEMTGDEITRSLEKAEELRKIKCLLLLPDHRHFECRLLD